MAVTKDKAAIRATNAEARARASKYPIAIIHPGGKVTMRGWDKAPPEGMLIKWATNLKAGMVTRYWPSRKGWMLIDVRNAQYVSKGVFGQWVGHARLTTVYPTEDAAVMAALHLLD